jgi:hypothetical protein
MSAVVKARMLGVLRRELAAQEFKASSYCEGQLQRLVSQGIARMRLNNAIEDSSLILRAEQSLRSLVRYFCQYSKDVCRCAHRSQARLHARLNAPPPRRVVCLPA